MFPGRCALNIENHKTARVLNPERWGFGVASASRTRAGVRNPKSKLSF